VNDFMPIGSIGGFSLNPSRLGINTQTTGFNPADGKKSESFLGMVDVTLPVIRNMIVPTTGCGITGEFNTIVRNHVEAMQTSIRWRVINKDTLKVFVDGWKRIRFYGAVQYSYMTERICIEVLCIPNSMDMGLLAVGRPTDTETVLETLEVVYKDKEDKELLKINAIKGGYNVLNRGMTETMIRLATATMQNQFG